MKVMTKAFGEVEVSDKQRIRFDTGIFGFEDIFEYVLLDTEPGSPFYWLQSEKHPETAFVLIDPLLVDSEYVLDVDDKDVEELEIHNDGDTLVFSIVTIHSDPKNITANLLGPIIINKTSREAKQVINKIDYSVKSPLFGKKEAEC